MRNLTVQYHLMLRLPTVWKSCANQGIIYTIANREITWRAAESLCKSFGGGSYLATPRNTQQSQCIEAQMINVIPKFVWIGMLVKEGNVYYADNNQTQGEHLYTNWNGQQEKQQGQQCVAVYKSPNTGKNASVWIPMKCDEPYRAVCQRPGELTQVQFIGHSLLISRVNRVQSYIVLFRFVSFHFVFSLSCPLFSCMS